MHLFQAIQATLGTPWKGQVFEKHAAASLVPGVRQTLATESPSSGHQLHEAIEIRDNDLSVSASKGWDLVGTIFRALHALL